ncbi:tetratricopeptide repeat protein [Clostridium gasigenes]|uniref:tetratricopeptide repeat protein n=1 Tax=Clostridium gasigenes TaxID=94869 RepID=UPI001C0D89A7|nr:tetratricopeptide repeat protein [Clostridium gasigenes]MBU3109661.1 tetratricopeptide repeat protein [Clostridium gasigenes]
MIKAKEIDEKGSDKKEKNILNRLCKEEIDLDCKESYMEIGLAHYKKNELKQALENYKKALEIDLNCKEIYKNIGDIYVEQEKFKDAMDNYKKAIEIDLEYKDAYSCIGVVYYRQSKYEEALKNYKKALEIDLNCKEIYKNIGDVYLKQEQFEKAIDNFKKAIEIELEYKDAYFGIGVVYYKQIKYEEALDNFKKAIEIDPEYEQAYFGRALIYLRQKNYEKAIEYNTKAISIKSDNKAAYNNRGLAYKNQERYKEAIEDFGKAIEIDSDYKKSLKNRAGIYKKLGKKEEEIEDNNRVKLIEIKLRDEKFYKYVNKIEMNIEKKVHICELFLTVMDLKDKLVYTENKPVGHYTKVSNLKYLLKPTVKTDEDKKISRLRLNNVAYMNDPTEGEVFKRLLENSNDNIKDLINNIYTRNSEINREIISGKNNMFLASFSTSIDSSLPMWIQYSENGNGCCLVFDELFFDKEDKNSLICEIDEKVEKLLEQNSELSNDIDNKEDKKIYYCLHKIKYVNSSDDKYSLDFKKDKEIIELIKEIGEKLCGFEDDLALMGNAPIKGIIMNILDQVRFLFKDENYDHEAEVRLVKFEDNGNIKYTGAEEGFRVPHVYIELERELIFKEVILGPKVENVTEIANYLYYTDKVDIVSKSKIKYQ